jgi:hypothetical protein
LIAHRYFHSHVASLPAGNNLTIMISGGFPTRIGGPQNPIPLVVN